MARRGSILLVANRTAETARLREAVGRIAGSRDVEIHLLVPSHPRGLHRVVDPEVAGQEEAEARLAAALPSLTAAAGGAVSGEAGDADPMAAIQDTLSAATRRYFAAGLCCAVETRRRGRWESSVLALRSASPEGVLAEVEDALARGARVRLAAYSPSSLTRLDLPAPVFCSSPPVRLLREGDQASEVALDGWPGA